MRIALIGHACSPSLGSEPGLTWNLAWTLSRDHDVRLITHPQYRDAIESARQTDPCRRVSIYYLPLPAGSDPWNPAEGEHGLRAHYLRWQPRAAKLVRRWALAREIDLAHHVSWGTVGAPPLLADIGAPVVWGPLGGGEVMPWRYRSEFRGSLRSEWLRILRIAATPMLPSLRRLATRADVILSCNDETSHVLRRAGARQVHTILDCGLPEPIHTPAPPARLRETPLEVFWAGRFEPRKGLPLALRAMLRCKQRVRLTIAGDGDLRAYYEHLGVALMQQGRVRFVGRVAFEQMCSLYQTSHVFLFTSLRDRFGTIVLEAMAQGLVVVALDHCGVRSLVPNDAAVKIPLTDPDQSADALAAALDRLAGDDAYRLSVAHQASRFAAGQAWSDLAGQFVGHYNRAIERYKRRHANRDL